MDCWAASLGGCGGGPSREHIISKSQFDDDVITVHGLPWCKEPKTVGLTSLVAKNLCRDHNSELSPVDLEAKRYKNALAEIFGGPQILPVRLSLEARLIERWFLKTTINLALQEPGSGIDLSDETVRRAFGQAPIPRSQGFFGVIEEGEQLGGGPTIRFETMLRNQDGRLVMGIFVLHGVRAVYAFEGAPPVNGAMRVQEWNRGPHWLKLRWNPELEDGDSTMPPLAHEGA